jgi:hypothetical protein
MSYGELNPDVDIEDDEPDEPEPPLLATFYRIKYEFSYDDNPDPELRHWEYGFWRVHDRFMNDDEVRAHAGQLLLTKSPVYRNVRVEKRHIYTSPWMPMEVSPDE